jgi:hypothetical protein
MVGHWKIFNISRGVGRQISLTLIFLLKVIKINKQSLIAQHRANDLQTFIPSHLAHFQDYGYGSEPNSYPFGLTCS